MTAPKSGNFARTDWLTGQLLIAMPNMADPRFARTVVYICSHNEDGAMGLVVNRLYGSLGLHNLLDQLDIKPESHIRDINVHFGGPVETGRGFVLHSGEYHSEGGIKVSPQVTLTATIEILRDMAIGRGPRLALLALGYASWTGGQLENELQHNGWLVAPADTAILFDDALETKWDRANAKLGITPASFTGEAGHA